ncbi:hypothetical protein RUM44_007255 [Polyplax serrata]|uniref:Uncharacterized protein n=1 Tax=Polyplax serrata TaxID=468196 RepID=A0ABR1B1U5_POLSC
MAPSGFAQLLRLASRSTPVLNDEHAWNVQLLGITTDDLFAGNALGETSLPSHYDPALQTVIVNKKKAQPSPMCRGMHPSTSLKIVDEADSSRLEIGKGLLLATHGPNPQERSIH